MTPKIKEFAEKRQLKGWSFYDGILIGAEFAEWAKREGWEYIPSIDKWMQLLDGCKATTSELLDIFIDKNTRSL